MTLFLLILQGLLERFDAYQTAKDVTRSRKPEERNEGQCVTKKTERGYVIAIPEEVGCEHWGKEGGEVMEYNHKRYSSRNRTSIMFCFLTDTRDKQMVQRRVRERTIAVSQAIK